MTLVERVRAVLEGWRNVREVEMFGGLVFLWDGDPLIGVVNDELIVRVEGGGWSTVTGDVAEWVERSSKVVLAEAVVHWRGHLHTGGIDAMAAMMDLVHHDRDREGLQRILLDKTHDSNRAFARLAVTCLGRIGRIDGELLPEVVPRLQELLDDPYVGSAAEEALRTSPEDLP